MENTNIFQTENTSARNGDYIAATRRGFEFGSVYASYDKLQKKLAELTEKMGSSPSGFRVFISFLGIFVAIVLGFVESSNISLTLMAIGNFGETMAMIISMGFVCMGLIIGEELNAGLVRDEFTGKRKPAGRFWGAVIMGAIYLGIQVFLALQASAGGAADMQTSVMYTVIFSMLIASAEIAFGFMFLRTAIDCIVIQILKLRIRLTSQKLNGIAKSVEMLWQRYVFIMEKADVQPAEKTEAVAKAREFYANGGLNETITNE